MIEGFCIRGYFRGILLDNLTKVASNWLGVRSEDVMLRLSTCMRLGQLGNVGKRLLSIVNRKSQNIILFVL